MFKNYIQKKLEKYVRKYFLKHPEVKLVVVVGSIGKTSTKNMAATILSEKLRVRMEDNNHNTHLSAPAGILGVNYPENVHNIFAWLAVFRAAQKRIKQPTDVDVIIQELGTDRIGEIPHFGTYLHPNIAIVTAITPEHMEFFGSMDEVAKEELSAANFSEIALINRDDTEGQFAQYLTNKTVDTYGSTDAAEYHLAIEDMSLESGFVGDIIAPEFAQPLRVSAELAGEHSLRPLMGATAIAIKLGLNGEEIQRGVAKVRAVPGRMNILRGLENSILIDDTYNSSPAAAEAALQTLYSAVAPQRIAILGSMNELGEMSQQAHESLGSMCDPNLLAWVVTVGEDANKFTAPKARARGCQVKECDNALEAGAFVHKVMEAQAVILAKGSQGGVYLEEALKMLLHTTSDDQKLVRQSSTWKATKQQYFEKSA